MPETLIERPSASVALLRINRPEARNALSVPLRDEMAAHIIAFAADPGIRCIVITGDDKAFAAGADLRELQKRTVHDSMLEQSQSLWRALDACAKPVIAAVRGYALGGGCELALQCDIVIAGEGAKFGQPEVKVGIMPGAGGVQRFLRAAGKHQTMRWLLTGDVMSAQQGFEAGFVSEIVADAEVLAHALGLAERIAELAPLAVASIKENVILGSDASLKTALHFERKAFQLLFASEDRDEGIAAFLEKRPPRFKGR